MTTQNIFDLSDTWNAGGTTFTAIKMDVTDTASAAASLLLDLQVGGASKFYVSKSGQVDIFGGADFRNTALARAASFTMGASGDVYIRRAAAASLALGNTDAASPVAQKLSVQGVVAGTTNTAGANWTLAGSVGTGTGAGGSLIFQVAPAGGSGSAQNALANSLVIDSTHLAAFTGPVKTLSTVVASLPAAATAGAGARAFVTDANATTFMSTVAAGGANAVPVVSDGTNWKIG